LKQNHLKQSHLKQSHLKQSHLARTGLYMICLASLIACNPTVRLEAPKEPITINLNIKLDADVRLKLEQTAVVDIEKNPEVF